jgi:5-oxoprolinase (ATP-hydrolysing)
MQYTGIAVDTGGTFTDLVARRIDGAVVHLKVPSTPADPGRAVHAAIAALPGSTQAVPVRHGTTVATNALLERRGAQVVLITNVGFEDLLRLRRQARPDLYALHPVVPPPVVPPEAVVGVRCRRGPDGAVMTPLEDLTAWLNRHHTQLARAEAFAVCLLHAYAHPQDEARITEALVGAFPGRPVSASHAIAPVFREYERASTTVINAALGPVMARYLHRLEAQLTALQVMGSAGGLLSAELAAALPVHTVLSGPAGGVAGAWHVGQRCGREALLTLDMGGTSTDVSVLNGALRAVEDGHLAEHPLRVPLLPIETVGAGGGSVAYVDGGVLRVGPRSAGAVPGPACYGRAGDDAEPTVTDAHVVLGRIEGLLGGAFTLDVDAAHAAVGRLAQTLGTALEATAEAILAVAEATMARACKRVAMAQGVDPRTLSLVAFGGAGGLHACGVAETLGCAEVLFPAEPGVLSAAGILDAAQVRSATRTVFALEGPAWAQLATVWAELGAQLAQALPQGDPPEGVMSCRYQGQTHTLPVALATPEALLGLRDQFETVHRHRYGHVFGPDRPVEVVSLRLVRRQPQPASPTTAHVSPAQWRGPCVISRYSATLWLADGWQAERLPSGDLRCTPAKQAPSERRSAPALALALEVHRQLLGAIAEEMGATLMQAAFSANIKERRDYSCAVFDAQGQMLVHAAHIPVHLGSTPLSVRAAIDTVPMRPGLQVILNDPFSGGTHLPDVTLVMPVYLTPDDPQPLFYVANRAHHADVGGIAAGSLPAPRGSDGSVRGLTIDDEGVRLTPQALTDAVRAKFVGASRTPDERRGDLRAQEAANWHGARRLRAWIAAQGIAEAQRLNEALLDDAERRMRALLAELPDGRYHFTDALDDDGVTHQPVLIPVTITITGEWAVVDWTEAPDAVAGPLNAVRAIVVSAVFYAFRCLAGAHLPANDGLMRVLEIRTRPGSVVDARPPSAVSSGNVETSQRLVDAVFGALAQAAPHRVPAASVGSMNNVLFGGTGPRGPYVHYETLGGGAGGGPEGPGADAIHVHMTNTLNTPVEALEQAFPVRILRYAVREAQSAPPGDHAGGAGLVRAYQFQTPAEVTVVSERRTQGPYGLNGAPAGSPGLNRLIRGDEIVALPSKITLQVQAGDVVEVLTPGGGAWRPADHPRPSIKLTSALRA